MTETSIGLFKYYDPKISAKLQVDACKSGLGAVLIQDGPPIAYASLSLTETECRYAQIEKELLAVTFGCESFRLYIYAKRVLVEMHQNVCTKGNMNFCLECNSEASF